ncbi:MAG: homocysteine S-methyltransferase family protein [Planctomycetales bacterium]|nr:homocysteine S-methyltransferase family protein [Planctomycetales bacterium]
MTRLLLRERLQKGVFFVDGAMGTQLIEAGAPVGCCNDMLNIDRPGIVRAVHQKYIDAGVDAVITNTFGANALVLGRHGLADKAYAINLAAAKLARSVAGEGNYVLGDIGPCGDFLEPLGAVTRNRLKSAFAEQARGLLDGGVDGFIVETMTALDEVQVAADAVKSVSADLPILVSLAYDPAAGGTARTMMGVAPAQAAEQVAAMGIDALGFNCGTLDMDGYVKLAQDYAVALKGTGLLLLAEPNAGRPQLDGDRAVYTLSPDSFASALAKIREKGASILGGCCGTSPAHLAAATRKLRQ